MVEPNLKLLGETLRRLREQANPSKVSQFRLATLMRWEGTAPIIEIEKGRRRPRPETLNALGEALRLSPADIAYLHGLAGYRERTAMPPLEQVKRVLQAIEPDIARRRYPVVVLDYQFNHWMVNTATAALVGGSVVVLAEMMRRRVHGFDVVFDSRLPARALFSDPELVERERVFRFKSHNIYRRHEPFYLAYPARMEGRLPPADYARFARCWDEVEVDTGQVFPIHPHIRMRMSGDEITLVIHMIEMLHVDRLLLVGYYEPDDDGRGNRQRCEAYFADVGGDCVRAWDAGDPEPDRAHLTT